MSFTITVKELKTRLDKGDKLVLVDVREPWEYALAKLEEAANGDENMLPRILECVESYVTVGEISHRLRRVWGEYREAVTV